MLLSARATGHSRRKDWNCPCCERHCAATTTEYLASEQYHSATIQHTISNRRRTSGARYVVTANYTADAHPTSIGSSSELSQKMIDQFRAAPGPAPATGGVPPEFLPYLSRKMLVRYQQSLSSPTRTPLGRPLDQQSRYPLVCSQLANSNQTCASAS